MSSDPFSGSPDPLSGPHPCIGFLDLVGSAALPTATSCASSSCAASSGASPSSVRWAEAEAQTLPAQKLSGSLLSDRQIRRLLLIQANFGFSFSLYLLLPEFLSVELHASSGMLGLVSAIATLASVVAIPAVAWFLDKRGRKRLVTIGAWFGMAASMAFVCVGQIGPLLFLLRVIQGLAFAMVFNGTATMVTDLAPPERLGRAIGMIGLAGLATNAIAPAIAEPIAHRFGWGPTFVLGAITSGLAAVLSLSLKETRPTSIPGKPRIPLFTAQRLGAFGTSALAGVALGAMFTFLAPMALERGATQVSGFFIGYTVAAVAVRTLFGDLADRIGRRLISAASMVAYAAVVASAAWAEPRHLELLGAGLGLAHGLLYPALNALAMEGAVAETRGTIMSYFTGSFYAGSAVGTTALGLVAQTAGYPMVFWIAGAAALMGAAALSATRGAGGSCA